MKAASACQGRPGWYTSHAAIRTDSYVLLAAFLSGPPVPELLDLGGKLRCEEEIPEKIQQALNVFSQACESCARQDFADEFHRLFVGLGRGEVVPYGSWYKEKMMQSGPLALIRADLQKMSIVRQADTYESEDHAGVLCEIMALISSPENAVPHKEQARFFNRHMASWMMTFFADLQALKEAEFYRSLAAFGHCFLEAESAYLQNRCTVA
jgi:TorA maturation chaperone TorD